MRGLCQTALPGKKHGRTPLRLAKKGDRFESARGLAKSKRTGTESPGSLSPLRLYAERVIYSGNARNAPGGASKRQTAILAPSARDWALSFCTPRLARPDTPR